MKFCVTFESDHRHVINDIIFDCDCVAEIDCDSEHQCNQIANSYFGDKWLRLFPASLWQAGEQHPRGKIVLDLYKKGEGVVYLEPGLQRFRPYRHGGSYKAIRREDGEITALVCCPVCQIVAGLIHLISELGDVTPSVVCQCGFHDHVKLVGWQAEVERVKLSASLT